jgi:hypothetical protein
MSAIIQYESLWCSFLPRDFYFAGQANFFKKITIANSSTFKKKVKARQLSKS